MILVRHLDKAAMGTWALFLIVTTTFELSKSALLKSAHIRYVSGTKEIAERTSIASSSLIINILFNLIVILIIIFLSKGLSNLLNAGNDLSSMLLWFIPGFISMIFFSHFEAIQQSNFDFKGVFAGYLVRQVSFFVFILIHFISHISFTLDQLAIYQAISITLGAFVLYFHSKKYLTFKFTPSKPWTKKILGYGGYIFGSGIISNLFSNLDQLMTSAYMLPSSVAYYNTATRITGFIDTPSYAATEILFPKMSQASAGEGVNRVKYLYEKMSSILLSLITPVAIFIIIFPKFVILILAGEQYQTASPILQVYMINSLLGTMQNQAANTLNSIGKAQLCFILNTISLLAKLAITFICLINFGFYGAAIGTLITSFISVVIWNIIMKKEINASIVNIIRHIGIFYKNIYTGTVNWLSKFNSSH